MRSAALDSRYLIKTLVITDVEDLRIVNCLRVYLILCNSEQLNS